MKLKTSLVMVFASVSFMFVTTQAQERTNLPPKLKRQLDQIQLNIELSREQQRKVDRVIDRTRKDEEEILRERTKNRRISKNS